MVSLSCLVRSVIGCFSLGSGMSSVFILAKYDFPTKQAALLLESASTLLRD